MPNSHEKMINSKWKYVINKMGGTIIIWITAIDKILQSGNLSRFYEVSWIWTKYIFSSPEGTGKGEVEYIS